MLAIQAFILLANGTKNGIYAMKKSRMLPVFGNDNIVENDEKEH
jgi:hypothetical protein